MEVDTRELSPWADVHRILSNMTSLTVNAGGKAYEGNALLASDEAGNVSLDFPMPKAKGKAK